VKDKARPARALACVSAGGELSLATHGRCAAGASRVSIALLPQPGPRGATGRTGPTGPRGATGPAGAALPTPVTAVVFGQKSFTLSTAPTLMASASLADGSNDVVQASLTFSNLGANAVPVQCNLDFGGTVTAYGDFDSFVAVGSLSAGSITLAGTAKAASGVTARLYCAGDGVNVAEGSLIVEQVGNLTQTVSS
jgi:hypothetical protein